jgi:molybdopterin/thiamine biosynthesis adenylyltransferase
MSFKATKHVAFTRKTRGYERKSLVSRDAFTAGRAPLAVALVFLAVIFLFSRYFYRLSRGHRAINMDFTEAQIERYSRHILLQEVGAAGQARIRDGKVLVVGAGGLGSPVALYLAAAGVGTIGLVDGEVVETSNLQRQVIHFTRDVGKLKVRSAKEKMNRLNPDARVVTYPTRLSATNAAEIIREYDFVVDGTDNFAAKYLVNDACVLADKPFSIGGIARFEGQTMTRLPGTACYRCLFPVAPPPGSVPGCSRAGVLGAVAGMLGTIQAAEVLKYLAGAGEPLANRLLLFDARTMTFKNIKTRRASRCPACGDHPTISRPTDHEAPGDDAPDHCNTR